MVKGKPYKVPMPSPPARHPWWWGAAENGFLSRILIRLTTLQQGVIENGKGTHPGGTRPFFCYPAHDVTSTTRLESVNVVAAQVARPGPGRHL
jgi:hypothetical protein